MKRKARRVTRNIFTPLLTEVLPYEVPVSYSNFGFFKILSEGRFRIENGDLITDDLSLRNELFMSMVSGRHLTFEKDSAGEPTAIKIRLESKNTVPLRYQVKLGQQKFRRLAIPHPLSQLAVAGFYAKWADALVQQTRRPSFSVRYPVRRVTHVVPRDAVFKERVDLDRVAVETVDREYSNLVSYFSYGGYRFIQRLYSSDHYRRVSRRFSERRTYDIHRFFESIYTHSIQWAVDTRVAVKDDVTSFKDSLAGEYDSLMQSMNERETHGILIGPEVSRIFAEVLLADVDRAVEREMFQRGYVWHRDYEVLRYVDDYLMFSGGGKLAQEFSRILEQELSKVRLFLNPEKSSVAATPVVDGLSNGRAAVARSIQENFEVKFRRSKVDKPAKYRVRLRTRWIEDDARIAFSMVGADQIGAIASHSLVVLERKVDYLVRTTIRYQRDEPATPLLDDAWLQKLLDICRLLFAMYDFAPRVSNAVKLVRVVSQIRSLLEQVSLDPVTFEWFDDQLSDEIAVQLRRSGLTEDGSVEALFLIALLAETCRDSVSSDEIAGILGFGSASEPQAPAWLHPLAVVEILRFTHLRPGYELVHQVLEDFALRRIRDGRESIQPLAETSILALSLVNSPAVSRATKAAIVRCYKPGVSNHELDPIICSDTSAFVEWGPIDLYARLLEKSVRDVY